MSSLRRFCSGGFSFGFFGCSLWFLFRIFFLVNPRRSSGRDKIPAPICVHNGKSLLVNLHLDRTGQSAQAVGQQLGPVMKSICRRRNRSCCFYLGSRGTSAGNNLGADLVRFYPQVNTFIILSIKNDGKAGHQFIQLFCVYGRLIAPMKMASR